MIAFALAYLLAWFGALFGLPELPEHELQLFMASHYEHAPFSLIDERWYGGVDVAWRPPAFYVCTALLARVPGIGLERAYALLVIASVLAFVFAVAWLVRLLRPSWNVAAVQAVNPALYVFTFGLGQTAFVAALALCATHAAAALSYLRDPRRELAVAALAAGVLAPLVHPLALPIVAATWIVLSLRYRLARFAAVPAFAVSALILLPFFQTSSSAGSGPVSHNKWLLLVSVGVLALVESRRVRFAVPVLLALCCYVLGDHASAAPTRRFREAVAAAEYGLSKPDAAGHHYLTLGLGSERLAMSRRTRASLIDGGIPWQTRAADGRALPYDSLDALPLATDEGKAVLDGLLATGQLRWVVSAAPLGEPILRKHGYRLAAAFSGGVVLWEKEVELAERQVDARPAPLLWTVSGPLLLLLLLASMTFRMRAYPLV